MLRYKIKIGNTNMEFNEIPYNSLFFSNDLTFISGVTSSDYGIRDGQDILLQFNDSSQYNRYKIEIKRVTRRGFVELYNIDKEKIFSDDNYTYYKTFNGIGITNEDIGLYWCEDGKITIGGVNYEIDFNTANPSLIFEDGTTYGIIQHSNIYDVIHFTIRKNFDYNLDIDFLKCSKSFQYVLLPSDNDPNVNEKYDLVYTGATKVPYLFNNRNSGKTCEDYTTTSKYNMVKVNGILYNIQTDWRNVEYGDRLHLYLGNDNTIKLNQGDIINAKQINSYQEWCPISTDSNGKYISFYGKKYYASDDTIDYVVINSDENHELIPKSLNNEVEYKITYLDENGNGYFTINDKIIPINVAGNLANKIFENIEMQQSANETYVVKKYNYVTINDEKFLITNRYVYSTDSESEGVNVIINGSLKLIIDEMTNSNCARCVILDNDSDEMSNICYMLYKNQNNYVFELYNPLYSDTQINYDGENLDDFIYSFSDVHIYNPNNYYNLPIKLDTETSNNLHQEYIVENQFFNKEVEKSINRIVDMEKDIYYPYYLEDNDNKNIIDEIVFDLHFRTRDDDWNINNENKDGYMSNWNIFDYYKIGNAKINIDGVDDLRPSVTLTNDEKYYQPSDLLGLLNFNDNDIFYQKSKVGKSFLRLLFYDSPDPKTQSLLHMATIFVNEGELFKKYIDNRGKKDNFVSINKITDVNKRIYDNMISVFDELIEIPSGKKEIDVKAHNPKITIDESKRLSCRFSVKNRYESNESSEGYYLYIFKEYSNGLHDKPIYLKVEFNHAGEGRTINFMIPTDNNGELLDLSTDNNIKNFKNGVELKNLYSSMFIELRTRYDEKEGKYIYYLPQRYIKNSDKDTRMRFNLYEIKIRDEIINPLT